MFQFHKVRLKVNIKAGDYEIVMFQFHKVRLKGIQNLQDQIDVLTFQFHKVRLKV